MTLLTEDILDQAIAAAEAGRLNGLTYDQGSWCGTACCVLGFARHIAGEPEVERGPRPGEIADTPRAQTIARLMGCAYPDILRVMRHVRPDGTIDLTGAKLARANLAGAKLAWADFAGANLAVADFAGAKLAWADFAGANLAGAKLAWADFVCANLAGANLAGANFAGANLAGANFAGANFAGAKLTGANFAGANFAGADFAGADLTGAKIERKWQGRLTGYLGEPVWV